MIKIVFLLFGTAQVLGWSGGFFPTMGTGGGGGGWMTTGGGGGGGGGWMTTGVGGGGGGWIPTGGGGGGMFPTMNPGGGGGDGGFATPDFGGGGGMTPGWGGGYPTMNPGGDGGWMTPGWGGGGGGGWGTSAAPTEDPTCEGNGGQCVADGSCDGEAGGYSCAAENTVCCLPNVLPSSCGNPFLVLRQRRSLRGSSRIVGGSEAQAHSWPWQVSLQLNRDSFHFCGASLINEQWAVTAAHCVVGASTVDRVVMGEHDRTTETGREIVRSAQVFSHPRYSDGAPYPNDIALLKLSAPVAFNEHIFPACLPLPGTTFDTATDECWISGWGDTKNTGDETTLNELNVTLTDNAACANAWGSSYILDTHICVGNGEVGACNGDSGGPLSCLRKGRARWELAGATSWGASGCRSEGLPNVYTRVSEYRDWIATTIRKNL